MLVLNKCTDKLVDQHKNKIHAKYKDTATKSSDT